MKKHDLILFLTCIAIGAAILLGYRLCHRTAGTTVTITIDGDLYKTLPLDADCTIDIPGKQSGSNRLTIKNGQASITEADCPDQLCMHQSPISHNGESLVCLPHKVIVEVHSDDSQNDGYDAIAR